MHNVTLRTLGFGALPAGFYGGNVVCLIVEGKRANFWSSTEYDEGRAYSLFWGYDLKNCVSHNGRWVAKTFG